ncbi:MAG: hypothetical protein ABIC68_04560 [Candidatus Omnitrophota bacterium]
MKKRTFMICPVIICMAVMVFLSGCETAKAVDRGLTEADDWVREVAW